MRGELDWIVMKALEKDRSRRYESANGLARDIERHLKNKPVSAMAPSVGYRLYKFARRNRVGLIIGSAFVLLLVSGTLLSLSLAVRATRHAEAEKQLRKVAESNEFVHRRPFPPERAESNERRGPGHGAGLTGQIIGGTLPPMKTWPLQDAKNQFSQVVELALTKGPQTVTRHGEPVAVVVSADEFKRLARPAESVAEFFAPLKGSGIKLERRRDLPRKLKL